MGCWNATCGISGLPIHFRDPVVGLIIRKENLSKCEMTPSYPWDNFVPASLMIRGNYDDYGGISVNEDTLNTLRRTQDNSTRIMGPIAFPDGEIRWGGLKIEPFLAEYSRPDAEEKTLLRQDEHNQDTPFSLWLAHAGVWDGLCDGLTVHDYRNGRRSLKAWLAERVAESEAAAQDKDGGRYDTRRSWGRVWGEFQGPAAEYLTESLTDDVKRHPSERAFLVVHWEQLAALYSIQSALRQNLWPTSAWGSQAADLRPRELLCDLTLKHIAEVRVKHAAEDGDYDPEETD